MTKETQVKTQPRFKKQLASFTQFVKWHVGLEVVGEITRKFENATNYGSKSNIELKLLEPVKFTNGDGEVVEVAAGELLNIGQVAGLSAALTLPIGSQVQIICTGRKELGRGRQPAWEFEVYYD